MTVRIANSEDKDEVCRLFVQGHKENGLFSLDMPKVDWWLTRMLCPQFISPEDSGPRGVIGVIGKPEHLEGLAFLTIGNFWYTKQRHLEEFIVYVDPDYRYKGHNKALIEWMKDQSRLTGLTLMTGIFSTKPRMEAKVRLYERMLPKAGAFFCFEPLIQSSSFAIIEEVING